MTSLDEKYEKLQERLRALAPVAVAFSGGVDSTFLLAAARECVGDGVAAITVTSPFMPQGERREAEGFCAERGIPLITVEADPLGDETIRANTAERCYLCKRSIFGSIKETAASAGFSAVADGSNADDAGDYRPGMRALRELGIASPLLEAGLTKSDIRALSRRMGLGTADKPSMACLATRIPYGTPLDQTTLQRVEAAEDYLRAAGFDQVRVRVHGDVARIEVKPSALGRLMAEETRQAVNERLRSLGFAFVSADLAGFRSGSMNTAAGLNAASAGPHDQEENHG